MRRMSHRKFFPAIFCFFLRFLTILSEGLEQVKFLNIVKNGEITKGTK